MTHTPPRPPEVPAALRRRRVYFEQLTTILLHRGVDGATVGRMVAELDHHVMLSGNDPADELGPVGQLADSMGDVSNPPLAWVLLRAAGLGVAVGLATALAVSLFSADDEGLRRVPIGIAVYVGLFAAGNALMFARGAGSAVRRMPPWWLFVPFVALMGLVSVVTQHLHWTMTTSAVAATLLPVLPVAAGAVVWHVRRSRVEVPGGARHLRRLGWGPFGR